MSETQINFLGHTSILVKTPSLRFIFDPNFAKKIGMVKRLTPAVFDSDEINLVQAALVTNAHANRLDIESFGFFKQSTQVITPLGVGKLISSDFEFHVSELKPQASLVLGDCTITALPALHRGFRRCGFGFSSSLNYLVKTSRHSILYIGDTRYDGEHFHNLGQKYKIDVALIATDHVGLDSFAGSRYLKPAQTIQAFEDLGAKILIPHSFGAFNFAGRSFEQVKEDLLTEARKHGVEGRLKILKPGEYLSLDIL